MSPHTAEFCGHRPCGSSDTATKIVYIILQDHVIKGSGDFMEGNSSLYIPTLPKIHSHRHCVNGCVIFSLPRDLTRARDYMVM